MPHFRDLNERYPYHIFLLILLASASTKDWVASAANGSTSAPVTLKEMGDELRDVGTTGERMGDIPWDLRIEKLGFHEIQPTEMRIS